MMPYNQTYYEKTGVKVTDKPFAPSYDKSLQPLTFQAYELANVRYPSPMALAKIQKWVQQYPEVPLFKNYLVVLNLRLNRLAEAKAAALDCYEKHPNYFFSKLTLADLYLDEKNYDEAAKLLDLEHDGASLLQNRDVLHETEWMPYQYTLLKLVVQQKKIELAHKIVERAWLYDTKHKLVKPMMDLLIAGQMSNISLPNKIKIERKNLYKAHYQPTPTTQMPIFHHSKVADLYQHTLDDLPKTLISDLMTLPRTTLIADLRSMLQDAVARQQVLFQMAEDFETTPKTQYLPLLDMPVHAMRFLAALNATEALADVLNFFRQEDEAFEYWSENLETECIESIYLLGRNQLQAVQDFVLEGGNTYGARMTLSRMVAQVVLQEPERRAEVLDWFKTVIYKHLDNPEDAYLIDTAFLSFLIGDVLTIRGTELESEIKRLFETGWIDEWVQGDWKAVQTELHTPQDVYDQLNLPETIFEFYEPKPRPAPSPDNNEILKKFSANKSPFEQFLFDYRMESVQKGLANFQKSPETIKPATPVLKAAPKQPVIQKVGRNDLCPCGSGKKYKKCHGT
jgi:tetratricopeptide (TPR) repeat protein